MQNKDAYRHISAENTDWPFYLQDWWLDACCTSSEWDAIIIREPQSGLPDAVMPFEVRSKWGLRKVTTPEFTPWSGPWFRETTREKPHHIMAEFEERLTKLFQALPKTPFLNIKFSPAVPYGIPVHWIGYQERLIYTYRLTFNTAEHAFQNFNRTVRRDIQNADHEVIRPKEEEFFMWLGALMGVRDKEEVFMLSSAVNRKVNPNPAFYSMIFDIVTSLEGQINTIDLMGSQDKAVAHAFRALSAIPVGIRSVTRKSLLNF